MTGRGLELARPELHRVRCLLRLADVEPVEAGHQPVDLGIAALGPESVERAIARRAQPMVGRALHRAEGGYARPCRPAGRLAMVEERVADALTAIAGQQHRLPEIKGPRDIPSRRDEGCLEFGFLRRE